MTDITNIVETLVYIVAILIGGILIPLIKAKLSAVQVDDERTMLDITIKWLEIAVSAAEEAERAGLIDKTGKYNYAVSVLEANGITFDAATTQALIDAKVWELFNQFKDESADSGI